MSETRPFPPNSSRMQRGSKRAPSVRSARVFGIVTALGCALVIFLVLIFALTGSPYRASIAMGCGIATLGAARGIWPGQPWFASRSKWSDVMVYLGVGLAIILLAPLVALGAV
ncbi:DUF3017 domain-containing protein [Actinomycetaceae bacterium MB13-C1-2]|nr:DUF3017 domain-containing protein [Actinomycetaceae bacterium MB13-C1-2]